MSKSKKIALTILLLFVAALVYGWFSVAVPTRYSVDIGAAMLAKQVCSCVFLAERDVDDCRADQMEAMDRIQVDVLREEQRVRAWVSGFGERSAYYRAGFGCTLD